MISLSNLLKQQYVIQLQNDTRVINSDVLFLQEGYGKVLSSNVPDAASEESTDGFSAGLDVETIQVEPEVTAEEIIRNAQNEADGLLVFARLESERVKDEAKKQADLLFEQKKQQGYQEGVSKLQDEVLEHKARLDAEFRSKEADLEQTAHMLQAEYEEKLETLEKDMVDVMIQVFHKVFNIQFDNKKQILLHLIKDTLLEIDAGKRFIIRVADSNYKFVESHVEDIKEKIGNDVTIDVVNDRTLEENDCMIETATGVFDCSIDMVLSNLEKDIRSLCR